MEPQRTTQSRSRGLASTVLDGVRRVYCWVSDRVYRDFAWAFEPLTTTLTLGWMPRWRRAAARSLPPSDILDLGCGTGALLKELGPSRPGRRLVGIDLSPTMTIVARRRNPSSTIMIIRADVRSLPFRDGSFGGAATTFPTRAVLDPSALKEAARVLRPTRVDGPPGRLVVLGIYLHSSQRRMQRLIDRLYGAPVAALHREFIARLRAIGFVPDSPRLPADLIEPTLDVLDQRGPDFEAVAAKEGSS